MLWVGMMTRARDDDVAGVWSVDPFESLLTTKSKPSRDRQAFLTSAGRQVDYGEG